MAASLDLAAATDRALVAAAHERGQALAACTDCSTPVTCTEIGCVEDRAEPVAPQAARPAMVPMPCQLWQADAGAVADEAPQAELRRIESELNYRLLTADRPKRIVIPKIICADGFTISVQAGRGHYCSPRDDYGPWHEVECGFPSAAVEALLPYADGDTDRPTKTVYGYVPIKIVAQVIADHGGFAKAAA